MSEKRFYVETVAVRDKVITDKDKFYSYEDLDEIVVMLNEQQDQINKLQANVEYLIDSKKELIEKIGEQQATINELEKNFDDLVEWASEIAKRNVVLDEKTGEQQATITALKKENEQLRQQNRKLYKCALYGKTIGDEV